MTGTLLVSAEPDSSSLNPGKMKTFQEDLNHDDVVSISFLSTAHMYTCSCSLLPPCLGDQIGNINYLIN